MPLACVACAHQPRRLGSVLLLLGPPVPWGAWALLQQFASPSREPSSALWSPARCYRSRRRRPLLSRLSELCRGKPAHNALAAQDASPSPPMLRLMGRKPELFWFTLKSNIQESLVLRSSPSFRLVGHSLMLTYSGVSWLTNICGTSGLCVQSSDESFFLKCALHF